MTTATVEQTKSSHRTGVPRQIWHNPKTIADFIDAMHGRPYDAMCGKRCKPGRGGIRLAVELSPMERCQVCADLVDGGQRIAL